MSDHATPVSARDGEHGFCNMCHVAYEPGYTGPCQEPRPPYDGSRTCSGTVTLDEGVRMQRRRAEKAEAESVRLREVVRQRNEKIHKTRLLVMSGASEDELLAALRDA